MKRKIRICFVSILGYPLYNKRSERQFFGGGAAVQLYLLSKELAKDKNFDVNVITGNYNLTENKIEIINNIRVHNIRPIKSRPTYYFLSLLNLFITLIKIKPDIVIQRAADKITGVCAFYCKRFNKRFIYSIANLPDINGSHERGFFGKFYKYGLNNAKYLIAQHKDQIIQLQKFKNRKFNNIVLIKSSYEIIEAKKKDKKYILWVGRAIDWKRPELFLELAKKYPNKKFLMICNKTDEKIKNIEYWNIIFKTASKISNIKFLEYVPFHKINIYFEKSTLFVNTSIYEGFPNTFLQACLNQTPIMSLNINPEDILTKYKIGFWCKNNFDEMIKNLKKLLENEDLYLSYSQNCLNYVKKYHNIKKNIKCWIDLINKNYNKN